MCDSIDVMESIVKNTEYIVTIEAYSSEGYGIARIDGRAVFVPKTLKGEVWQIKILKVTSSVIYAKGLQMMRASESRTVPECPYFSRCGGCDLWHMSYEEELAFKLRKVNDALRHIGKQSVQADEIIPASVQTRYRNKGIFNVCDIGGSAYYGFYKERSHELVNIDVCLIQMELGEKVCRVVTDFLNAHNIRAYDEESGTGTVRHVFCRSAVYTKDAVACIISARGLGAWQEMLVDELILKVPELTGIVLNINKSTGNTVLSGEFYTLFGNADITDYIGRNEFVISPQAFFQINPPQAEKLYARALEYASEGETNTALELYCGAGTISLALADRFKEVRATEIVPEAIENAKANAERNGINNVEFMCGDAAETAEFYKKCDLKPDVVVVDPPRKGMNEEAVEAVASIDASRIVYVSCNPATLARDILRFNEYGYCLEKATAVDMFPRTMHVETVCLLSKLNAKQHIEINLDMDELDLTDAEKKATYQEIKDYVLEHSGLKVSSLYIAQVKQKCGIIERENYNKPKSEDAKQPQCPPDKEKAIKEALKHFGMI